MSDSPIQSVKEVANVIKLGSGLLGKSAIVLGIFELAIIVAACRIHNDWAILGAAVLGAALFYAWFTRIIDFAHEHPAEALLEGSQWAEHRRETLAAKGFGPEDLKAAKTQLPGTQNTQRIAVSSASEARDE